MTEEDVASCNKAFDTQFADLKNHSDFAHYSRTNSQGKYTIVLAFTELEKTANADYVKGLEIFDDFKAGTTLSEFEAMLTNAGFTKVTN